MALSTDFVLNSLRSRLAPLNMHRLKIYYVLWQIIVCLQAQVFFAIPQ